MTPFFLTLLLWAALYIVAELIRPKPEIEDARPAGLGDFNFPTATEGRAVPILWGRCNIKGANVVYYGGLKAEPIIKEIKTGIFSSEDVITGHRYYITMQLALCLGEVYRCHAIRIKEHVVSSGIIGEGILPIDAPDLFGGEETGSGGVVGTGHFYTGNQTQLADSFLTAKTGYSVNHRGICYYMWKNGYMGTGTSVPAWAFELTRRIDGLNMESVEIGSSKPNSWDNNPMNVLYEIMTNTDWGLRISTGKIDLDNFRDVALDVYYEGNGFSMILDNQKEASAIIDEILRQIDGILYFNRELDVWRVTLARDHYLASTLDIYDEDSIIELTEYSRMTWQETTNEVRVLYNDRDEYFKETYALAQDMANMILQGGTTSVEVRYPGVKNKTLANQLAWRDLRTLAYPLAKISIKVNRKAFNLAPGDVFKFSWYRLAIEEVVFRISRIDYGNIEKGEIIVDAIQDIFSTGVGSFGDPPGSGAIDPVDAAVAPDPDYTLVLEAPGQMVAADPTNPQLNPRVWMGASFPGGGTSGFQSYSRTNTTPAWGGIDFVKDSYIGNFVRVGTLTVNVTDHGTTITRPNTTYTISFSATPDVFDSMIVDGNSTNVSSLINLVYIGDECIGFEKLEDMGGNVYKISRLYRGLFNTVPIEHSINDLIFFIGLNAGGNLTENSIPSTHTSMQVQLRSIDRNGEMTEGDTPIEILPPLRGVATEPLPPREPWTNNNYADASIGLDGNWSTETGQTGEDGKGTKITYTLRAWRINEILLDHLIDSSPIPYLDDSPEFDHWFTFDPAGTPVNTVVRNVSGTKTPVEYLFRNDVIIAVGANATIPSTIRVNILAKHDVTGTVQSAVQTLEHTASTSTTLIGNDDVVFGGLTVNVISASVTFGENGTYVIDIQKSFATGIVEANIAGGGWNTIIIAGNTTGDIITTSTSDVVQLRFTEAPSYDRFFDITGPVAELGYGVLKA